MTRKERQLNIQTMDINLFYNNGLLNKNRLREDWFLKNLPYEYQILEKFKIDNNMKELKFSNIIFNQNKMVNMITKN